MKPTFKRTIPMIVLSLMLILAIPLAGCSKIASALKHAVLGNGSGPYATGVVTSETPSVLSTSEPIETPQAPQTPAPEATPEPAEWKNMPSVIPRDQIFAAPEYTDPVVSGDGRNVLYRHIRPDGTGDDIVVRNMQSGMETVVPYPDGTNGIPYFEWSGDGRHVLFMIDNSGDENNSIYSVDIASGNSIALYSKKNVNATIIGLDEANPEGIYFQSNSRDASYFDLYWCNVVSGETKLVMQNPGNIDRWYFDHQGKFRIVETVDSDGGEHLLLRTGTAGGTKFAASDWKEVIHWAYGDTENSAFFDFTVDGKRIFYTDSTGRNTAALMEMALATGKATLIDSDPDYDVSSTWLDLKKDRVTAVQYVSDRSNWKALDSDIGAQFDRVKQISSGDFGFTSSSKDDRYWLVYFDSDTDGRSYYYVDSQTGSNTYLFNETPILKQYEFAKKESISFTSSDGLKINGYATFPVGQDRKNLPMVLLVHGGPQYRDTWGFDSEVQWLANRGYLVLQVNFRGSTGYGKQFVSAGDREWGGKMQQDLTDAVNWAISQGYADKSRVAIMGASYGGYAALAGAAFTPDVYACAVDMFGPSSLLTLMNSIPNYWKPYWDQMVKSIGDPKDEAFMKSRSPLYSVDKIKIPVLIAQGGNDVRVTPEEAEQMVDAMKAKNLPVDYMYFKSAGHGFNTTEDNLLFYKEAESFLAKSIGGRTE